MRRKLLKIGLVVLGFLLIATGVLYIIGGQTAVYRADIEIDAPPETVFSYLTEIDLLLQWMDGVTEIKPLTEGGHRVGARARVTIHEGEAAFVMEDELLRSEPSELLQVRLTSSAFVILSTYTLHTHGDKTHLSQELRADYKGFIRLFAPFASGEATRKMNDDFGRLKRLIEQNDANEVASD